MLELPENAPMATTPSQIVMLERAAGSVDAVAWDAFVRACDGSFLGTWRVVRAHRWFNRVRLFEFFVAALDGSPRKVGQCALAIARGRVRFLDRLHLRPGFGDLWDQCMDLVIERCGAAKYEYGSPWNPENRRPPCRRDEGGRVTRLVLDEAFLIDLVDFRQWPGFEAYRRDVSENIRRDYRKAAEAAAFVETRHVFSALRDVITLVRLRRQVMGRNGEPFSIVVDLARHLLKLLCLGDLGFIATVRADGRCHAAFFGVRFGDDVCYLAGGTEQNAKGYGSYLFLTLIEQ
jgi:hypothetical protein